MFTLKKQERLRSKLSIQKLFKSGHHFNIYPLKIIWIFSEKKRTFPVQVLISVPKNNFKKAVDRNYIKRIIKESYRQNKHILYDKLIFSEKNLNFAIIYLSKEIIKYHDLEKKIIRMLNRLIKEHEKNNN